MSFNGRTADSGSANWGSNPCTPAGISTSNAMAPQIAAHSLRLFGECGKASAQGDRWHLSISPTPFASLMASARCAAEYRQSANAASAATASRSGKLQGVPFAVRPTARSSRYAVRRDARRRAPITLPCHPALTQTRSDESNVIISKCGELYVII